MIITKPKSTKMAVVSERTSQAQIGHGKCAHCREEIMVGQWYRRLMLVRKGEGGSEDFDVVKYHVKCKVARRVER